MPIEKLISFHIEKQFPAIYREDGKELVQFVKEYYKFLETNDKHSVYNGRRLFEYRDIDTTLERMLLFFKNKYLSELPFNDDTVRIVLKNILGLYRRKGTQDGLALFFRLFYDEDIKVYYPARDIFLPSDSEWKRGRYLELKPNSGIFTSTRTDKKYVYKDIIGQRIYGTASKSTAIVDKINFVILNKSILPIIFINDISGDFINSEGIICEVDGIPVEFGKIRGSLSDIAIDIDAKEATIGNQIGDQVTFRTKRATAGGSGLVSDVTETFTGIVEYEVEDGGWGYTLNTTNLYVSNQIVFLDNEDLVLEPSETVEDISGNRGMVIGQTDFSLGIRSAADDSFDNSSYILTIDRPPSKRVGIANTSVTNVFSIEEALLRAATGIEPERTRFNQIVSGSRRLGDLDNSGSVVNGIDALVFQRYLSGELTDSSIINYIEGEFNNYLSANPSQYNIYPAIKLTFQSIVEKNDSSPGNLFPETSDPGDVKVAQLKNIETVSLIFDVIGDFTNVVLASTNFNNVPPALRPMSGTANPVTLATKLEDAFDLTPIDLGTIVSFENINPGIDYVNDVFAIAYDTRVVNTERREQLVTLEDIPATLTAGKEVSQGGIFGKVTGVFDKTIRVRPYSYYGFVSNLPILFEGQQWNIESISTDFNSPLAGFNANIKTITQFGVGKIQGITVSDSGYGYASGDEVDIIDKNGRVIAKGAAITSGQGSTGGFWSTLDSHLNGYTIVDGENLYFDSGKKIQDSNYYQEYSYEILSRVGLNEYEQPLKDITHVAGSKVFGTFNFEEPFETVSDIRSRIDLDFTGFDDSLTEVSSITLTVDSDLVSVDTL